MTDHFRYQEFFGLRGNFVILKVEFGHVKMSAEQSRHFFLGGGAFCVLQGDAWSQVQPEPFILPRIAMLTKEPEMLQPTYSAAKCDCSWAFRLGSHQYEYKFVCMVNTSSYFAFLY